MTRRGAPESASNSLAAAVNSARSPLAGHFKCPVVAGRCECRCLAVATLAAGKVDLATKAAEIAAVVVVVAAIKAAVAAEEPVAVETVAVVAVASAEVISTEIINRLEIKMKCPDTLGAFLF